MSDFFTRIGEQAQSARRHGESDERFRRAVTSERERRLDLQACAKRFGLQVRWRRSSVPGSDAGLEPYLTRPGCDIELPFPPGDVRR
jgi:hypothetical protein